MRELPHTLLEPLHPHPYWDEPEYTYKYLFYRVDTNIYFSRKVLLHVSTSNIYLQESRKAERAHDYVEYSDNTFLEKLGITLPNRKLKDFWPPGGPKWDALRARFAQTTIVI